MVCEKQKDYAVELHNRAVELSFEVLLLEPKREFGEIRPQQCKDLLDCIHKLNDLAQGRIKFRRGGRV